MPQKPKYTIRTGIEKHETRLKKILSKLQKKNPKKTASWLAKQADLENSQMSIIISGKQKDMYLSTAKKICNALSKSLHTVFGD